MKLKKILKIKKGLKKPPFQNLLQISNIYLTTPATNIGGI